MNRHAFAKTDSRVYALIGYAFDSATQLQHLKEVVKKIDQFLMNTDPFVLLAEASRLTGVSLPILSEAIRMGKVPALQVQPRRWLVRVSAVRSYFARNE